MAFDAADALAKTYARNKKLLSLRSITNSLQQTGLLEACTYRASVPRRPPLPGLHTLTLAALVYLGESARANGQASTGRQGVVPCYFIPSCTLQNYIRDFVTEEDLFFLFESNCPVCHRSDPFSYVPLNPIRIATAFR